MRSIKVEYPRFLDAEAAEERAGLAEVVDEARVPARSGVGTAKHRLRKYINLLDDT